MLEENLSLYFLFLGTVKPTKVVDPVVSQPKPKYVAKPVPPPSKPTYAAACACHGTTDYNDSGGYDSGGGNSYDY